MMNEENRLRELQEELNNLQEQLHVQTQKINELQQRLMQLSGKATISPTVRKTTARPAWSLENFIGLRLIHFIGIIVLVIGLSIGVKYAIDRNLISEGMRIILAYAAGIVLYLLSLRLRKKYPGFSAILFSGALASLYFTTYGAHVYYDMFSFPLAFALMVALTVYTVYEAISYNREEIALLGLVGAYGIPFLISKNADRADLFFLYISLINIGVVFLSVKKAWKNVTRVGNAITWALFIGWASARYHPGLQWVGLLFMIFFFLLFQSSILASRIIRKTVLTINDVYQLVLNNLALYIAALFVFGSSFSNADIAGITLAFVALTAAQSLLLYYLLKNEAIATRMMASVSLIFFVIFIGFNWDGFTVTLLWLLTAVIVFVWGFKMKSVPARMAAILLIGTTLGKLLAFDSRTFTTVQKVVAYLVLGVLLLVVSFFYQKFKQQLFSDDKE